MSRDPINPLTLSSYEELDTELICVLTRIRLRRFWHMLGMWLAYSTFSPHVPSTYCSGLCLALGERANMRRKMVALDPAREGSVWDTEAPRSTAVHGPGVWSIPILS